MTFADLYDLAVSHAWDDLYDTAQYLTPTEFRMVFAIYTLGFTRGAYDKLNNVKEA